MRASSVTVNGSRSPWRNRSPKLHGTHGELRAGAGAPALSSPCVPWSLGERFLQGDLDPFTVTDEARILGESRQAHSGDNLLRWEGVFDHRVELLSIPAA